ncbi:RING finger protein 112-like [Mantella aurantiaca]
MAQAGTAHFSKLEEDITCSVCFDELSDPVSITCGHTFCRGCITKYWSTPGVTKHRCPECRKICPKDQLIPAYRLQSMVTKVKEEQSRQIPPSSLQLVYTDSDGRLQLDESVVQRCFLDGEVSEYPLCLICVIGEKRRGKTTLLNYILRAFHCLEGHQQVSLGKDDEPLVGFEWRSGADRVTKGIWIWSKPFILERNEEKLAVYVLDTEGSLDIEGDQETCLKLYALSMLLSSYLIFNVNACLKTTDLDYLEMYLQVSELTGKSFSLQNLQHLDLLVRDWQVPDCCGREAGCDYLQHESEKLRLRKDSEYRLLLDTLRSPSVSSFLLPHPGNGFLRSSQGTLADMEEDFRGHLTGYISDLAAEIWNHQKIDINGEKITCSHVGNVLKEFVTLLKNEEYGFNSPLEMSHAFENLKLMNTISKEFNDFLKEQNPANASLVKVLLVLPSKMRTRVDQQVAVLLDKYKKDLKGANAETKEGLMDEMINLLENRQESFCAEYSDHYTQRAVSLTIDGVAIAGGGVASKMLNVRSAVLLSSAIVAVGHRASAFFGRSGEGLKGNKKNKNS